MCLRTSFTSCNLHDEKKLQFSIRWKNPQKLYKTLLDKRAYFSDFKNNGLKLEPHVPKDVFLFMQF
jgi:hypothetical protein